MTWTFAAMIALAAQDPSARLASTRIDVDFQETPLADALAAIRARLGVNLMLDPKTAP